MKKYIIFGIIFALIIIIFFSMSKKNGKKSPTIEVKRKNIKEIVKVEGKIEANEKADLTFSVVGRVTYLPVKKGDKVKQGQILASIDATSVVAEKDNAMQDFLIARWNFDQQKDDNKMETIEERRAEDIKQFSLNKAVRNFEVYNHNLINTYIYAPFAGTVTNVDIKVGNYTSSTKTAITIQNLDNLKLTVNIPESQVTKVRVGLPTILTLDAFPGKKLFGEISSIDEAETILNNITYYQAEIKLPENPNFRSGMAVDVDIETNKKINVLTIPLYTISDIDGDHAKVNAFVNNKPVEKDIIVGLETNDGLIEIISGLNEGDKIMVNDLLQ